MRGAIDDFLSWLTLFIKIRKKKTFSSRYLTLVAAGLTLGIGLRAQPDSRLTTWARGEASRELASEE